MELVKLQIIQITYNKTMTPLLFAIITTCIIVYVWDYIAFPQHIADSIISAITHNKIRHCEIIRPFGCSLCMTQWTTLIFFLCVQPELFWVSFILSWSTQYILLLYNLIDKLLLTIFKQLEKILH